jgi:hypothetical protein
VTVDPEALAAAFAHFDSRGVLHGDAEFNHAATMRLWAADVWAWVGEKEAEIEAARRSVARAERVVGSTKAAARAHTAQLRAAVAAAVDNVDPDRPDALITLLHALNDILAQPDADSPAAPLKQLPTPRPRAQVAS